MDNIFVLLSLFFILPTIAEAKCSNENGVNSFGDNCGFMCHCQHNTECEETTGECSSGCARGWYGPGCQYRDILEYKYSKFSDNGYSLLVTDGDSKSCLRQVKSSSTKHQSWSVRLDSNETINEIQIVTTAKSLANFKNFKVFVEYTPSSGSDETVKQTCFRQGVDIPKSTTFTVLCDKPVIGNYVEIEFEESQNGLELCDVKINGGRNLAFNRTVSQVSKPKNCPTYCNPEGSVNGLTRESNQWVCSYTAKEKNPWWKVDIGYQMKIWSVQIVSFIGNYHKNKQYDVHITNDTNDASTYSTKELSTDTQTVALNLIGRFVTISINGESNLAVCEVSVFGDCPENRCGYNCEKECHCEYATIWEKISGNCSISCNKKDKDDQCNTQTVCGDGYYGQDCSKKCSNHCKHGNKSCDSVNGHCNKGCKNGWMKPLCTEACDLGFYGQNCFTKCSDHCKHKKYCNKVDGKCKHGCMDGWKAPLCDQACGAGFYGRNCEGTCSEHCEGGNKNCNTTTGYCKLGCQRGWTGLRCVNACPPRKFGAGCEENCASTCKNDVCYHINGSCRDGCKPGYQGNKCERECGPGMFGENCQEKCSSTCKNGVCSHLYGGCSNGCKPGYHGNKCEEKCHDGKFGEECEENCPSNCNNTMCDHVTGNCTNGCKPGYKGNTCGEKCLAKKYGVGCKENCSVNCKTGACNHVNGNCSEGCNHGFRGKKCKEKCNNGYYGDKCANQCNAHCKEGGTICRHTDGVCLNGCQAGWNGKRCDSKCGPGKFGIGCKESCPSNCKHDVCGYANGDCDEGCKLGFQGEKCKENCISGTFGDNCNTKCSDYCEGGDKMCRPTDGHCLNGCKAGWNGTDCFSKCDIGFYGKHCALVCGNCLPGKGCNHVNGTCHGGCQTGYSGATCLQAMQTSIISNPIVAGGVAVLVILILIGIIAFVWHKQRNQNKRKDEQREDVELRDAVATASNENRRQSHGGNTQLNTDDSGSAAAGDANIYNNFPMHSPSRNAIPLSNLLPYVKENLANPDHFATEFQEIPYGMKKSSAVAKKSFNRGKNRYKDMHAYDETRVKLKKLPNIQGSDYINASSIKGHHKEYAYIAAQGPIDSSMDDFWRMIWEKDVYTIAMVTNLVELEKTKCQQYWPAVETSTRYGNVLVNTASEIIYYDFTIRNFNVSFEGEPQRNIRQFHFTSWPDKSVPKRPSSLIQFWRKVRKNDENKDHTWLVHCSAGVGRTGTFIALDILYDQGKDKGFIDVYQCVKELRNQRVNMVQTKEQYVYLHGLMVEALLLFSEPVPLDNIHKVVRDLKTVDQATKKTKMLLQYEALKKDMTILRSEKEVKEMYSAALLKENSSKNRSFNVLPPNDFRPFLVTNIPGCTNYINAVLTPSYGHSQCCYVTQKPLENTAVDFCRLLYEQNVKVIVKFHDNEKNHVEPDMSIGPFKLKKVSEEDKVFYTMTVFNMAYSSKNNKITQLEFKNWNTDQITPTGPENMLHFLQEVERLNRIAADSPLLVQCLDGSEKSGLFITLMNIFERVRLDKEVCIPQVIRELRYIRQQFIPNFEQFQFCYNAVVCYVDSHQMYANM